MTKEYQVISDNGVQPIRVDEIGVCPLCDHAIDPQYLFGKEISYSDEEECAILIFRCTNCGDIFIARYNFQNCHWIQVYVYPNEVPPYKTEECIKTMSPRFVKIYSQAKFAEDNNMGELVGVGYRKSLEFLMKDFLIYKFPDKEQFIISSPLSDCINTLVKYDNLKISATRATWIGNDFAHYERIHTECDLYDLKRFITSTLFWISAEFSIEDASKIKSKHKPIHK